MNKQYHSGFEPCRGWQRPARAVGSARRDSQTWPRRKRYETHRFLASRDRARVAGTRAVTTRRVIDAARSNPGRRRAARFSRETRRRVGDDATRADGRGRRVWIGDYFHASFPRRWWSERVGGSGVGCEGSVRARSSASVPDRTTRGLRCVLGDFFVVSGERSPGLVYPGTQK